MSKSLSGQVIVVTGGAGRLGSVFCRSISEQCGIAIVADTNLDAAKKLAADLCNEYGPQAAVAQAFDICRASDIELVIADLNRRFGRIDAVVNSAYPQNQRFGTKLEDVTYNDFCENISLHAGGYFITAQRFAEYFSQQGRGNIVFVTSIYGLVTPRFEIYAGTSMTMPVEYAFVKAGLLHLTRYLAKYYKEKGIRVNALSPGGVLADQPENFKQNYGMHAASGKMLQAADLAGSLIYLLSQASAHVTGQNLVVDDGWIL